jgi:hypothetical protein
VQANVQSKVAVVRLAVRAAKQTLAVEQQEVLRHRIAEARERTRKTARRNIAEVSATVEAVSHAM